jgi:hypothetical protein
MEVVSLMMGEPAFEAMRRFRRPTVRSQRLDNPMAPIPIHFRHYSFGRPRRVRPNPYPRSPATVAGSPITRGRQRRSWG